MGVVVCLLPQLPAYILTPTILGLGFVGDILGEPQLPVGLCKLLPSFGGSTHFPLPYTAPQEDLEGTSSV